MWEWMYRSTFSWPRHLLVSGQIHAPAALPWGKSPRYPLDRGLPSQSGWCGENFWPCPDSNSDPSVVQPVVSHYTNCAIPAHCTRYYIVTQPRSPILIHLFLIFCCKLFYSFRLFYRGSRRESAARSKYFPLFPTCGFVLLPLLQVNVLLPLKRLSIT
jgi:hypothetical protein